MLTGKQVVNVDVNQIILNRYQPRDNLNSAKLQALAESIKKFGMIQPIILRKVNDKFEIVVGGRRYEASKIVGYTEVPSIIIDISDSDMAALTLTENMQKEELSPIEEAKSYQKLQDENKLTITDIALQTGKTESFINNKLRLLSLAPEVQNALINNSISEGHAKVLLRLTNPLKQVEVLNKIILERLPVKETSIYVDSLQFPSPPSFTVSANTDKVSLNDLTKENLNIKSALNDLEVVNKNSPLFNEKESIIKDKKEEKNMDMNSLNQVAQNNSSAPQMQNNNMGFFPSFDGEPANMNMTPPVNNFDQNMVNTQGPTPGQPSYMAFGEAPQMPDLNNQMYAPNQVTPPSPEQPAFAPASSFNNFGPEPLPQPSTPDFRVDMAAAPSMMGQNQTQAMTNTVDVTPAVNALKGFISSLEQMGFKIVKEEQDGMNEYNFNIKIQKIA